MAHLLLLFLLSSLYLHPVLSSIITFNTSSPCAILSSSCSFVDPSSWNGGVVPSAKDDVIIVTTVSLNITCANDTITSNIIIRGPVNFIISGSKLGITSTLKWDALSTVNIINGATLTLTGGDYSVGSSLYINDATFIGSRIKPNYTQISNSKLEVEVLESPVVSATGLLTQLFITSLVSSNISIIQVMKFAVNTITLSGTLTIARSTRVAFFQIIMQQNAVFDYSPPPAPVYSYFDMNAGNIIVKDIATIILRDNASMYIQSTSGVLNYVLGNNVEIIVERSAAFSAISQVSNGTATIYAKGDITFIEETMFSGKITQDYATPSKVNFRKKFIMIPPKEDCFEVFYLRVYVDEYFECVNGRIDVTEVYIVKGGTSVTAREVIAESIIASNSTINADVIINGLDISDFPLRINGHMTQFSSPSSIGYPMGKFNFSVYGTTYMTPFLVVQGNMHLNFVEFLLANYGEKPLFSGGRKLAIAESESKVIQLDATLQASNMDHSIYYSSTINDGVIYLSRSTLEAYQVLIAVFVSIAAIFALLTYYYRIWKKTTRPPVYEHELQNLGDT